MAQKPTFTSIDKTQKHRVHMWVNTKTLEPLYGIQANVKYGVWAHVVDGSTLLLYPTKDEAKAVITAWASL